MIITTTYFVNINNKHLFKQSLLLSYKTTFTTLTQNLTTDSFGLKKGLTNVTETKKSMRPNRIALISSMSKN